MAKFSARSMARLETCDPTLQRLFLNVVEIYDCTILIGARGRRAQEVAYEQGRSRLRWPDSKHNVITAAQAEEHGADERPLSLAVDAAPWIPGIGVPWPSTLERIGASHRQAQVACWAHFGFFAGVVLTTARQMGITAIRWGGDWDSDGLLLVDQGLDDGPHFELRV